VARVRTVAPIYDPSFAPTYEHCQVVEAFEMTLQTFRLRLTVNIGFAGPAAPSEISVLATCLTVNVRCGTFTTDAASVRCLLRMINEKNRDYAQGFTPKRKRR
jgi:hypothetical protein